MSEKKTLIRYVVLLFVILALSACASGKAASPGSVTLKLAISDAKNETNSESIMLEFAGQVNKLSNGSMTIEPVWDAGKETKAGFERGVIQLVRDGKADIGLAASRAWDSEGIHAFQALQAPFLIDNDALAEAVAKSEVSSRMLESISKSGLVGLTIWPEDLRHPFSTVPDKPILSPADFNGRKIRVTSSMSEKLVHALGGTPMYGEGGYQGAESGLRQAISLSGKPVATGNVTFFPKYQVLFANRAAFEQLSDAQRAILRQAAAAAQAKAIAEHPSEVEAARTWCAEVNAVVLASDAQVAEFVAAAQPVMDEIEKDPQNAELVAAIRELKAKTPPSPGAGACESTIAQPAATQPVDEGPWSGEIPPNGSWQATLTTDDVIKMGVPKQRAADWSGVYTLTFNNGDFHMNWEGTEGAAKGKTQSCNGTYEMVGDFVRVTLDQACGNQVNDIQWRLDDEGFHIHMVAIQNGPEVETRALLEARPYKQITE